LSRRLFAPREYHQQLQTGSGKLDGPTLTSTRTIPVILHLIHSFYMYNCGAPHVWEDITNRFPVPKQLEESSSEASELLHV
jgi:hypothetical protein